MNPLTQYISSQFRNPRGFAGSIISLVQNIVNEKMYKNAVALVNLEDNEKVLDIGYGNGHLLEMIYKKRAVDMYGIDISEDAKEMATKKNRQAYAKNQLHLEVGDCCALPYENDTFSAVTSINTVYFWEDIVKGLSEIRRTLKSGKSFYNVVYSREYLDTVRYTQIGYKKFTIEELIQYGEMAGFSKVELKDIVKGKSFVVIYTK